MKSFKRSLIALLAVLLIIPTLTGCSKSSTTVEKETRQSIEESTIAALENSIEANIGQTMLYVADSATFESVLESGQCIVSLPFSYDLLMRWKSFEEQHGRLVEAYDPSVESSEENYNGHLVLKGEDGELMRLNIVMNSSGVPVSTTLEAYSDDSNETLGSRLATAGGNTLSGIIVVFFVLAFLCILISCLKFVNVIGSGKQKKAAEKTAAPAPVVKAVPQAAAAPEMDDKELIAVIAAAIAASENTSPDGFVVRSIKRLNNNKW